MRVAAFLVCAITAIASKEIRLNKNGCPIDYTIEKLLPHANCNQFYQCFHGTLVERKCSDSLLFNEPKNICDWPHNVECKNQLKNENYQEKDNNEDHYEIQNKASSICAKSGSDGVLVAHEHCNKFYQCSHGKNVSMRCPGSLVYNLFKEWCNFPENVKCGDRIIPDSEENDKGTEENDNGNDGGGVSDNENNGNGSCNCVPGEAPSICARPGSDGVLVAHKHCNKFYQCSHGKNVSMRCPGSLVYNPFKEWCDFPENVKCGDRIIPDSEENYEGTEDDDNGNDGGGVNDNDNNGNGSCNCVPGEAPSICAKFGSDGVLVAHEHCNKFYQCSHGKNVSVRCPGSLVYNPFKEWCDFPENVKCGDRIIPDSEENDEGTEENDNGNDGGGVNDNDNNGNGSCNCVPGEAPSICAKSGSDGVLVAHEHCNKFYQCSHGKNVSMRCPGSLVYNPFKEWCDFPENVKCGDRIIPDSEENYEGTEEDDNGNDGGGVNDNDNNGNGSCNCVPGEAPSICAKSGSDGVLVAHEHCNKFYQCSHGKNVSMRCPGSLVYNPFKEWCDFPENVKCGDRIIPDSEENYEGTEEDDNGNDGGGVNDNDNNGNGSCNCVPGEAPSICARPGSDGVLVAHEHCNKFYQCSHGKYVSMRCPGSLVYNPFKEWCDFPENVKCGDCIIPDSEENYEKTEQEESDNGSNDNGSLNCDPAEAPTICAKVGSEGVLVAHEYCKMFYKCAHGQNIGMKCPENLVYNCFKERCDFPANVHCGNRIVPDEN